MHVFDKYGNEQPWSWLVANFGPVDVLSPDPCACCPQGAQGVPLPAAYYRLTEIHENDDLEIAGPTGLRKDLSGLREAAIDAPSALITLVLDAAAQPVPAETAVFSWPDAPALPGSGWLEHGVTGQTKDTGLVDFAMGKGAYYFPPTQGPHSLWLYGPGRSDCVRGLGMIGGTNHRHLDLVFQWSAEGGGPPPPPSAFDGIEILDAEGPPFGRRDAAWIAAQFGQAATIIHHPEPDGFHITRLVQSISKANPMPLTCTVLDADGEPLPDLWVRCARIGSNDYTDLLTNPAGQAAFPLTRSDRYPVPGQGPFGFLLPGRDSDHLAFVGRAWGDARGDKVLHITWQQAGSAPPPPPPPDPWRQVLDLLLAAQTDLDAARALAESRVTP